MSKINLQFHQSKSKEKLPCPNIQSYTKSRNNNLLSYTDSITWLKKRHMKTAHSKYLKTREEMKTDQEIAEVFEKIDYDKSG